MASRLRMARPVAQLRAGRRDWYRITNAADRSAAEIAIYDEVGYFGVTASDFLRELNALDVDEIAVRLNTPGGDVFDGVAIMNALKNHRATVTTYVDGLAASIGSVILQAGDERVVADASQVMIHEGFGLVVGTAADMRQQADLLDQVSEMIAGVYADRAGGTADEWRAAMKQETWYSGSEAVTAGLADRVASAGSTSASWDLSIYAHAGRAVAPAPPDIRPTPRDDGRVADVAATIEALRGAFA